MNNFNPIKQQIPVVNPEDINSVEAQLKNYDQDLVIAVLQELEKNFNSKDEELSMRFVGNVVNLCFGKKGLSYSNKADFDKVYADSITALPGIIKVLGRKYSSLAEDQLNKIMKSFAIIQTESELESKKEIDNKSNKNDLRGAFMEKTSQD